MAIKWITLTPFWKTILILLSVMIVIWLILSLYVRRVADESIWMMGQTSLTNKALVIYNPDPFYNLDEQITQSFAKGLAERKWQSKVVTVAAAQKEDLTAYGLLVFCTNTYNWAPDKVLTDFILSKHLMDKPSIAITLGAGTTDRAQRLLEEIIVSQEGNLLDSRAYWLLRPNRENPIVVSNIEMANMLAHEFGKETGAVLNKKVRNFKN